MYAFEGLQCPLGYFAGRRPLPSPVEKENVLGQAFEGKFSLSEGKILFIDLFLNSKRLELNFGGKLLRLKL